ncbi:MAG: peptidylprolyl isomerase [Paracoccaceae bacterium]
MTKTTNFLAATALALGFALPALAEEVGADTVVATVNGQQITLGHMIAVRKTLPAQYQSLADDVLFNGVLEQLIQQSALAQIGAESKTKADMLNIENQERAYLSAKVLDAAAGQAVTDAALKSIYDEKYANAAPAKEYHAAHILVETEEEAAALKLKIDAGEDFAKLATEISKDRGSAANGGDLGWFGLGMMVQPFEDAVVAMTAGTVSDPVKTDFGWHLIKLDEVRAKSVPSMEEVTEELSGDLRQKAVEDRLKSAMDAATITRAADGIDPAVLKQTDLIDQ